MHQRGVHHLKQYRSWTRSLCTTYVQNVQVAAVNLVRSVTAAVSKLKLKDDNVLCNPEKKPRQNGRKMTSFRGFMAELGAGVDNELGGSAPHQCR